MEQTDIEDIIKPYGIFNIKDENVYIFLDKYYLTNLDSTNIKNEFIKYQTTIKIKIIKSDYLLYFYLLARNNGRYNFSDIALEQNLKINSGISVIVSTIFTSGYPSYTVFDKITNTEKIVYDFSNNTLSGLDKKIKEHLVVVIIVIFVRTFQINHVLITQENQVLIELFKMIMMLLNNVVLELFNIFKKDYQ